jgi:hypothetical protein
VLRFDDEKPAKKEAGIFYRQEREANTVYDLEHLNKYEYQKYSA